MNVRKVFGPPGSGKTTFLLNVVELELNSGVPPQKIGYFAFTRKAANEAKERAIAKFPHLNSETDFPWFRTLHSLAFRCLGVTSKDIMKPEHYYEFAKQAGLEVAVDTGEEDFVIRTDNPILNEINIARIRGEDLRTHYNRSQMDIEWFHFEYVERAYRHYKDAHNLIDFTDLLEMVIHDSERLPSLGVLIVDESQDLSRLQWDLVRELCARSQRAFLAGDDDQCQPPGTKVLTTEGEVNIEDLNPKRHRLVCYDQNSSSVVGFRNGYEFKKAFRTVDAVLHIVHCGPHLSTYTENHHCIVRWKPHKEIKNLYVVYLMQKDHHFRVGFCQFLRADGATHAWVRAHGEKADKMWFLKVIDSKSKAAFWEDYFSYKYGIPQNIFKDEEIFNCLDTSYKVMDLFADNQIDFDYPIYEKRRISQRRGGSQTFMVHAAALCPELMQLGFREDKKVVWKNFQMYRQGYRGKVYSLSVERHHNYFADGILTHNCIYSWAGADVKSFLEFSGEITVLEQSYRVPAKIHAFAGDIVKRIRQRQSKVWNPRDYEGEIKYYNDYQNVDISSGEWLVLASTNYMLNDLHDWIKSQGLMFERHGQRSISENVLTAVLGWESLRKGKEVPFQIARTVYKYFGAEFIKKGHKTLKDADPEGMYTLELLKEKHGLLTEGIWHEVLTKIGEEKRDYIIALLRRGTRLTGKIPIKLSTIHGAKGGEADNVLILTDLSPKFAKDYHKNADDIHRLFYVGVTRARQSLHIVLPKNEQKGFRI